MDNSYILMYQTTTL